MTDYPIRLTPAGYQVGATTDGRDWRPTGGLHETPRAAIAYSDRLQERATDERTRVDAPAALGVAPDAIPAPVAGPGASEGFWS